MASRRADTAEISSPRRASDSRRTPGDVGLVLRRRQLPLGRHPVAAAGTEPAGRWRSPHQAAAGTGAVALQCGAGAELDRRGRPAAPRSRRSPGTPSRSWSRSGRARPIATASGSMPAGIAAEALTWWSSRAARASSWRAPHRAPGVGGGRGHPTADLRRPEDRGSLRQRSAGGRQAALL